MRRVLFTGSRNWTDKASVLFLIQSFPLHEKVVLILGDCPTGLDRMALHMWATRHGKLWPFTVEPTPPEVEAWAKSIPDLEYYKAPWSKFGKGAGPIRNQRMVTDGRPTEAHAFPMPGGTGTWDCVRRCELSSVPIEVHKPVVK